MNRTICLFFVLGLLACSNESKNGKKPSFKANKEEVAPDSSVLKLQVELGRYLFYDKALSIDSSVSCASCHQQQFAFSDNRSFSLGHHQTLGNRNAMALMNLKEGPYFLWDGAASTLEKQVMIPLNDTLEMNLDILKVEARFSNNEFYQNMAKEAYGRPLDPFVITRSITAFEHTIVSKDSRYDRYLEGDESILNEEEKEGEVLFFSDRLKCSECHSGKNFTDYSFQNNGAVTNYTRDSGRIRLTFKSEDKNLYKVPSLRNCEVSAPYLHDGSIHTLEEMIDMYASGGHSVDEKSNKITGFELSLKEKASLLAFLKTLTDQEFLTKEALSDPFEN